MKPAFNISSYGKFISYPELNYTVKASFHMRLKSLLEGETNGKM